MVMYDHIWVYITIYCQIKPYINAWRSIKKFSYIWWYTAFIVFIHDNMYIYIYIYIYIYQMHLLASFLHSKKITYMHLHLCSKIMYRPQEAVKPNFIKIYGKNEKWRYQYIKSTFWRVTKKIVNLNNTYYIIFIVCLQKRKCLFAMVACRIITHWFSVIT